MRPVPGRGQMVMEAAETCYVRSGGAYIAYRIMGRGPVDLILLQGGFSHVELQLEEPSFARFLGRLASFSRLIILDVRGTGLSDRSMQLPTLEDQVDDILAVLDAVGCERAALFGLGQGGVLACLFAAAHPGRAAALVLYGTCARLILAEGYPWGRAPEEFERLLRGTEKGWGHGVALPGLAPSMAGDEPFKQWFAKMERLGASPGNMLSLLQLHRDVDIRHVLPAIRVPALVMHRTGDAYREVGHGRYLAAHIPGAKYVELPGRDHLAYVGDQDAVLDEAEEFLTGIRRGPEPDRVLATILFTDIVGSTERAAEAGDHRWRYLLDRHNTLVRRELDHFRGREVDTAGDGFLATFDGPARAVRCARQIADTVPGLGLELRSGLHTGEIELAGGHIRGIAVHIGARVMSMAGPREVLVSSTVKDLVAGSGIEFADRGEHTLKGVPGKWRIYLAASA
ncbi:MAG: adenylate/guanylate cyclase domain-containing protein [Streptosporangiaceae bacterium]